LLLVQHSQYVKKYFKKNYSLYWLNVLTSSSTDCTFFFTFFKNKNKKFTIKKLFSSTTFDYTIFFLKKEAFYTKLKYSRVPQYDMASGAAASFLSGFYGFLVCEKFGFELIDAGDIFFLVVYVGLLIMFSSLCLKIVNLP